MQELEDDESEEEIIPEPDREDAWMTSGPGKWVLRSSFGDVKNGGLSMNDEVLLKNLLHGILKCRASPELTWNPKNSGCFTYLYIFSISRQGQVANLSATGSGRAQPHRLRERNLGAAD